MNIGMIGLGTMGRGMALNLINAGHSMTLHDLQRDAAEPLLNLGARWNDSPRSVAEQSEITFTSLPGPSEMRQVALGKDGILEGAKPDSVYIDLTTNSPDLVRQAHQMFKEKRVHMLDAPVWGSRSAAAAGSLSVLVGGEEAVFRRCKPILDAIGDQVYHTGPIGCGTICKLVNNCITQCMKMSVIEGLTLGIKAGVGSKVLWEALQGGVLGRPSKEGHGLADTLLKGNFDDSPDLSAFFYLKLARKDVGLATKLAREHKVPMAMAALCEQELMNAINRGWGDANTVKFLTLQEERAGVQVRI